MAGYLVLGMGFGIILRAKGFGLPWAFAMSLCIYAGSMQYVAIDLMTGGASLVLTALTTLAVNARHLFYGLSMLERFRNKKHKWLLAFTLTDENYSLLCASRDDESYMLTVSLLDYAYWVSGCVIGSLLGSALSFNTEGIDFALTALFLTVFTEQWLSAKDHRPALIGVGLSLLCLLIFGADRFLIPAMILIALVLSLMRSEEEGSHA